MNPILKFAQRLWRKPPPPPAAPSPRFGHPAGAVEIIADENGVYQRKHYTSGIIVDTQLHPSDAPVAPPKEQP